MSHKDPIETLEAQLAAQIRSGPSPPTEENRPQIRTITDVHGNLVSQMTLEQAEAVLVRRALAKHQGDQARAAEQLGLSLEALLEKIRHLGL